jgi:hypothetical protein
MPQEATMIELTIEQRQALDDHCGKPVRVIDPSTHDAYVLVRAEVFERISGVLSPAVEEFSPLIRPAMLQAQRAFWRELPDLLKNVQNHGKWVAYHGDKRVGLSKTRTDLYQRCVQQGLQRGSFYIDKIEEAETAPWVPTPLEESSDEFTDDPSFPPPVP